MSAPRTIRRSWTDDAIVLTRRVGKQEARIEISGAFQTPTGWNSTAGAKSTPPMWVNTDIGVIHPQTPIPEHLQTVSWPGVKSGLPVVKFATLRLIAPDGYALIRIGNRNVFRHLRHLDQGDDLRGYGFGPVDPNSPYSVRTPNELALDLALLMFPPTDAPDDVPEVPDPALQARLDELSSAVAAKLFPTKLFPAKPVDPARAVHNRLHAFFN